MILLRYKHSQKSLVRNCEHYLETMMMTDETTSEQLAEIEGQAEPVQVREGRWRTRHGDIRNVTPTPAHDSRAKRWPWRDAKYDQTWREDGGYHIIGESPWDLVEYLGPIEPDKTQELPDKTQELETKTQELPAEYTPPEGWRVLRFGEQLLPGDVWVNEDGTEQRSNILQWDASAVSGGRCIRRIVPQPEPESESDAELRIRLLQQANDSQAETIGRLQAAIDERADLDTGDQTRVELQARIRELETIRDTQAATIEELRSEVSYVQRLLGESRQRVTQLEELVGSLRNINEAQEKAFEAAGQHNSDLQSRLNAVCSEWVQQAETIRRLQIELDAAQQVPADSPELRQLRADLEQVTLGRDTYRDGYERVLSDLETARETAKAEAVEAIAEWLEPIRLVDSPNLANETLQHLPQIMRHLTGLDSPEDVD
jgi:uncharacterized coiled-coil protein SlyX